MELYQFIQKLYNNCEFKDEINFDEFIEGFMEGTFYISAEREAFWSSDDFLGTFKMNYKVDHKKQEIRLLFE